MSTQTKWRMCIFQSGFFFFQIFTQQIVHSAYTQSMEFLSVCFTVEISFTLAENASIKSKLPI